MNEIVNATADKFYNSLKLGNGSSNETHCFQWWCFQYDTLIILEALSMFLGLVGSFGNLMTVLAILFSSLRLSVNSILIGSLSFAGFLYCSLIMSMQAVIFHRKSHKIPHDFCSAAGGIRFTLTGVIMAHLAVIALYRFLNFVYINKYRYMSEKRQLIISLVVCWVLPLVFAIPPVVKVWGAFQFQPQILSCTFSKSADQSNRVVMVTTGFIIPCVFIIYCYARIGCTAYSNFTRVRRWQGNSRKANTIRISTMMMFIFLIFFLGTFPFFVLHVIDKEFKHPIHHIWTTLFAWMMYCCNPVVYTLMDSDFRMAYKQVFMRNCKKNAMQAAGTTRATSV